MTQTNNPFGKVTSPTQKYHNRVTLMITLYCILAIYGALKVAFTGDIRSMNLMTSAAVCFPFYLMFIKWVLKLPMYAKAKNIRRRVRRTGRYSDDDLEVLGLTGTSLFASNALPSKAYSTENSVIEDSTDWAIAMLDPAHPMHSRINHDSISDDDSLSEHHLGSAFDGEGIGYSSFDDMSFDNDQGLLDDGFAEI